MAVKKACADSIVFLLSAFFASIAAALYALPADETGGPAANNGSVVALL